MTSTARRTAAGWLVVLVVWAAGALWRPAASTALWREIWNAAHGPWFALLAFALSETLARLGRRRAACALAGAAVAFSLGAVQELVQLFGPRDADPIDALRNGAGALLGGALWWALRRVPGLRIDARRLSVAALALAGIVALAWPVVGAWRDARDRAAAVPTLWDPGARWTERFRLVWWSDLAVEETPPGGPFRADRLYRWSPWWNAGPRVGLAECHPDWRGHSRFVMELELLGDAPATLAFRVNDRHHTDRPGDRFEVRVPLEPGYRRISFPLRRFRDAPEGRDMDLTAMTEVFLYKPDRTEPPPIFLLGDWWLE